MIEPNDDKNASKSKLLLQYTSIGSQWFAGLLIAVFLGKWVDEKLHFKFPLLIWLLPLIFIVGMILKTIKDTSKKNK